MSTETHGLQLGKTEKSISNTARDTADNPLILEIKSGKDVFKAQIATNTKPYFHHSFVTATLAASLELERTLLPPGHHQRQVETPVGMRSLREYVSLWIQSPQINVYSPILFHIGVIECEAGDEGARLFVGTNFWNKVYQNNTQPTGTAAWEQLQPSRQENSLLHENGVAISGQRHLATSPEFAVTTSPDTFDTVLETRHDSALAPDPSRLAPHPPGCRSRSTSQLEAVTTFTNPPTSTPPTSWLDGNSARSRVATSASDKLQSTSALEPGLRLQSLENN